MSSLFDLIYSQTQPSQVPEEPTTASSLHVAATPLPSALKTYSQFTDIHEQTSTRTGRKHLSVQFIDQTKHRPRSLLRDLDQYSSTEVETDQSGLEDNDDEESGKDEGDPLSPKTKKKKRFRKFFAATPKLSGNTMPLYLHSPEFCNKEVTHFEGLPKLYCPNELAFVRFPQSEQSVLSTQRKLVRALWLQCFHGKDFEGALMALQLLATIDTIDFPDLEKLVSIITTSSTNIISLLQLLLQKATQHTPLRGHTGLKASMIGLFAQTFLAQGEVLEARKVFKQYKGDQSFSSSSLLLAYDSIIACQQAFDLIISFEGKLGHGITFPSMQDIVVDPLNMYYIVKFLRLAGEQGKFTLGAIVKKQSECSRMLKELELSFGMSTHPSESLEWIDFQFLFIAYLLGTNQMDSVRKTLEKIVKYHMDVVLPECVQFYNANMIKFYEHLTRLIFKFQRAEHPQSLQRVHSLAIVAKTLHLEYDQASCDEEKVYYAWLLFSMALIEKDHLLATVSQFIESHRVAGGYLYDLPESGPLQQIFRNTNAKGERKFVEAYERYSFDQSHWVSWKLLAVLLGPMDDSNTMDNDTPISTDTDIAAHFPGLMLAAQKVQYLPGSARAGEKASSAKNSRNSDSSNINTTTSFRDENQWWLESILSPTTLDNFSPTILTSDYQEILGSLQNRFEEIGYMYELDLQYLYQENKGNMWEKFHPFEMALDEHSIGEEDSPGDGVRGFPILFEDKDEVEGDAAASDDSLFRRLIHGDIAESFTASDEHYSDDNPVGIQQDFVSTGKVRIGSKEVDLDKITDLLATIKFTQYSQAYSSAGDGTTLEEQLSREAACQLSEIRSFFLSPLSSCTPEGSSSSLDNNVPRSPVVPADSGRPLAQLFYRYTVASQRLSPSLDFAVIRVRRNLQKYLPDDYKLGFIMKSHLQTEETVFLLGRRVLEILTYQALVSCHLAQSQDNLFLLRVVQILILNAMLSYDEKHKESAIHCLAFLYFHNINLQRALFVATECAFARIDPSIPPKHILVLPSDRPIVTGNTSSMYKPVPLT